MKNQIDISVVTCSKNRHDFLEEVVKSTKDIINLREHIIVDFSSDQTVSNDLISLNNKVKIIKVENEKNWWLTRAYNFGMYQASGEYILKLDADSILNSTKFNELNFEEFQYIGFKLDTTGLGNFLINKNIFNQINGFNEYIYHWGYDDLEIRERILKIQKIKHKTVDGSNMIKLYEHSNEERFNLKSNYYEALSRAFTKSNSFISRKTIWNRENNLIYEQTGENLFKINHFFSHKDNGLYLSLSTKAIFLKVYLNERFKTNIFNNLNYLLYFVPIKVLNKITKKSFYPKKQT